MNKKQKTQALRIATIFVLILIFTASWRIYKLFNQLADDLVAHFGVTGSYMPDIIIFVAVILIIFVAHKAGVKYGVGTSVRKMLKV